MTSRRKEIFFVALCVVFSALFTIGCSDRLLHPAQDGARILVQLENSSLRSGDTPPPTEKWQGSAWIENRDGSESHHQDISSETDELSITFENIVIGSEIRIHLDVTSSSETAKRYRGSSSWQKIIDDVNVIVIVLKEVGVDAATPLITKQPEGKTENFAAGGTKDITKELMVEASVSDGGALTYQWYSNTSSSTTGGTRIEGATSASYKASVPAGETKYFYCIVTNTNNNVSGNKTASVTSNVAILASIEGSLESITARYNGTNLWVGESSTNFTVTENYSGGNSVEISLIDGLYTVEVPENSIGNVPVTIKSTEDGSIQTQVIVPIKYELDVSNLTITGGTTVEQNGNLELTAQYKTVDGADVEYKLYGESGSSNTYKVIENVRISWEGEVQQSNTWEALADTATAGQKTAIVKLISKDEWCVTTNGIEKPHLYTVNAATSGDSSGISDENSLREAIDKANTGAVIVVENTFPIKNTIIIEKEIVLRGNGSNSLQRSTDTSDGDITGPMFEVKSSGNLTLESIILDGQYYDTFTDVENNPFLINLGTTTLKSVTMQNIFMYQGADYNSITLNCGTIYSAGELSIVNSTIQKITMNASDATNIFIASGSVFISNSTIEQAANSNGAKYNVLTMGADTDAFNAITYSINGITDSLTRVTQTSITPTSP